MTTWLTSYLNTPGHGRNLSAGGWQWLPIYTDSQIIWWWTHHNTHVSDISNDAMGVAVLHSELKAASYQANFSLLGPISTKVAYWSMYVLILSGVGLCQSSLHHAASVWCYYWWCRLLHVANMPGNMITGPIILWYIYPSLLSIYNRCIRDYHHRITKITLMTW